jgi:putative GTP pyrophosphokinase
MNETEGVDIMDADSFASTAPDYEIKKRDFYSFYSENELRLIASAQAFENLVHLLLSSSGIEGVKVSSRVKNKHECISKFDLKYRQDIEKSGGNYEIVSFLTDLVGVRVICLYESQISQVVSRIRSEFSVVKEENKSKSLYESSRFGYKGTHLDLSLNDVRSKLPEYYNFADINFELQVRSIVQNAWSEVDHRLKYKKQIPEGLKRRIVRLSALFELADQEFEEIRVVTEELLEKIHEKRDSDQEISPQERDARSGEPLNSFNFLDFVSRRYSTYVWESYKVDGFVDDVKRLDPAMTIGEFKSIFNDNYEAAQEYRNEMKKSEISINPYTHMRYMLVLHDRRKFSDMLYPKQKENFLNWVDGI